MRLKISHTTSYTFDPPPTGLIQVLRLTPCNHDGQYVADWHVDVSVDTRLDMQHDAFGNITHVFSHGPLTDLTVHVSGMVETQDTGGVMKGTIERFPPGFFLRSTQLTEADDEMTTLSRQLLDAANGNTLNFLHALMTQVTDHLTFDSALTQDINPAASAFRLKRGVARDFAHVFLSCARAADVPARFVSGHIYSADKHRVTDDAHAWIEAFVPQVGWIGFDPVNAICTTDAHARVAIGLDHLGAAPVRGTSYGGNQTVSVAVQVAQAGRQNQ
jgi:transglutaminase-like putative cysteine protease